MVTVEQFRLLDDPPGVRLELHNGDVVEVTISKLKHALLQTRILHAIEAAKENKGWASSEMAFRAKPEFELRVADVGWVSRERLAQSNLEDNLAGSPELVIDIAPSCDKRTLCMSTGCQEFWLVDPSNQLVEVHRSNGSFTVYQAGDHIPMDAGSIPVDSIFTEQEQEA